VQLVRKFSNVHGPPIFQWLNCKKLAKAKRRLLEGAEIASISHEFGVE
jgi:AraC-like DNA-binding protein